jgi:hypothetical protein
MPVRGYPRTIIERQQGARMLLVGLVGLVLAGTWFCGATTDSKSSAAMVRVDPAVCQTPDDDLTSVLPVDRGGQDTFVGGLETHGATAPELAFGGYSQDVPYFDYLRFDVAGAPTPVARGVLCVFVTSPPYSKDHDPKLIVERVTSRWDAALVATRSRPSSERLGDFGPIAAGWNAIDVSALVESWVSGAVPNLGVSIRAGRLDHTNGLFASGKYHIDAERPRLIVQEHLQSSADAATTIAGRRKVGVSTEREGWKHVEGAHPNSVRALIGEPSRIADSKDGAFVRWFYDDTPWGPVEVRFAKGAANDSRATVHQDKWDAVNGVAPDRVRALVGEPSLIIGDQGVATWHYDDTPFGEVEVHGITSLGYVTVKILGWR